MENFQIYKSPTTTNSNVFVAEKSDIRKLLALTSGAFVIFLYFPVRSEQYSKIAVINKYIKRKRKFLTNLLHNKTGIDI